MLSENKNATTKIYQNTKIFKNNICITFQLVCRLTASKPWKKGHIQIIKILKNYTLNSKCVVYCFEFVYCCSLFVQKSNQEK